MHTEEHLIEKSKWNSKRIPYFFHTNTGKRMNKPKSKHKMTDLSINIAITILSINGLNITIKRQVFTQWINKRLNPAFINMFSIKTHYKYNNSFVDIYRSCKH